MNRTFDRQTRRAARRQGIARRLRGHSGPITFLAIAGVLGIASGFALASPNIDSVSQGNPPQACGTNGDTATRINEPTSDQTTSVAVIGGATLTFVFDNQPGGPYSATWTSDAPFTGTIVVKAGNEAAGGGETTFTFTNATEGTVYSPFTNIQGQTLAISHVDTCGTGTTTTHTTDTTLTQTTTTDVTTTGPPTTTTVPGESTTTTVPITTTVPVTSTTTIPSTVTETTTNTSCEPQVDIGPRSLTTSTITETSTHSVPGTTVTETRPDTTFTVTDTGSTVTETGTDTVVSTVTGGETTVTDCTTVPTTSTLTSSTEGTTTSSVAGTTSSGSTGGTKGTHTKGDNDGGNGAVAGTATNASGGLPFTGLHVPLLILVGLGMATAGLVLRRRLGSLE